MSILEEVKVCEELESLRKYSVSTNMPSCRVRLAAGQGSTRLTVNVEVSDLVPTVPVISKVYEPGLKLATSVDLKV